ncbi:ATP-binding cassette domain-containing protein [Micrococcales bacterium 31B]|nr:ATP-binding cassette domain-containing protein [Micrococcales bacterium 31B]
MISVIELNFQYHPRAEIFRSFSWSLRSTRHVLLGPNGAGKSTLLSLVAGAETPRRGNITVNGTSLSRRTRKLYQRRLGWMPQSIVALRALTVREQVAYAGWLKGMSRRDAWKSAAEYVELVDLSDKMDSLATSLSGGQLRRVGLAQALVHSPDVLLLDEPTAGLDPAQRATFRSVLQRARAETRVLMSTHQVDDLDELFDEVSVLANGESLWEGTVQGFLTLSEPVEGSDGDRRGEDAYRTLLGGRH